MYVWSRSATATLSPEAIAVQIAQDQRFCESVKDAIAESIRRQLVTFTSFASGDLHASESLHPIHLDLIIDGFAVRLRTAISG